MILKNNQTSVAEYSIMYYKTLLKMRGIIYIYKVVISVCLFVCPIITHEPLDRFASKFNWGTRENHGNALSSVLSL